MPTVVGSRLAIIAPDLARGMRAAIATVVPFYLAVQLDHPALGWVALGGWLGALADPGGTRRARALGMVVFVLASAVIIPLASISAALPVVAGLVVAATSFAGSLARVFGSGASTIGTLLAVVGAIAGSSVAATPFTNGLAFAAGSLWAVALSTIVWRGWPHLPLRVAIATVFDALAKYAEAAADAAREMTRGPPISTIPHVPRRIKPSTAAWGQLAREHQRAVRAALEAARTTMVALRARHTGESPVGANLRVVLGDAEAQLFALIAFADEAETSHGFAATGLDELAETYRGIRERLLTRQPGGPTPTTPTVASTLGTQVIEQARHVFELSRDLDVETDRTGSIEVEPPANTEVVRDALTWKSPILHHAIRSAVTAAVGTVVGHIVSPDHATWVTVTAIAVQQPYLGSTLERIAERVVGTIFGGALAALVMMTIHNPLLLAIAMFPLAVAAVVTRPRSYRLFVLFLTPVFVLVADRWHPELDTAVVRVADVALGGAIAAVLALIAPAWERKRLPDALAAAIASVTSYAGLNFSSAARSDLIAARRGVGAALETAEASLERMLSEPKPLQKGTASAVSMLTYMRRLSGGFTTLDESRAPALPEPAQRYVLEALEAARAYVVSGTVTPAGEPPLVEAVHQRLVHHASLIARLAAAPS